MSRLLLNLAKNPLQPVISTVSNANLVAVTGAVAGMEMSGLQTTSIFAAGDNSSAQQERVDAYTKLSLSANYADQFVGSAGASSTVGFLNQALQEQFFTSEDFSQSDLAATLYKLENLLKIESDLNSDNTNQENDLNTNQDNQSNDNETEFKRRDILDHAYLGQISDFISLQDLSPATRSNSPDVSGSGGPSTSNVNNEVHMFISQGNHDLVQGTNAADTLIGSLTGDTLIGHDGDDFYFVQSNLTLILEDSGNGYDSLQVGVDGYQTSADIELIKVAQSSNNYLLHSASPDSLLKNTDVGWHINGSNIDQTLIGGSNSDVLNGMGGLDTLIGGAGDDIYYYSGGERVIESTNAGLDTVKTSANFELGNNIENAMVDSNASFVNLTGNELNNILVGGGGANTLIGNQGNDTLLGNGGEDIYIGGSGSDTFVLNSSENFAGEIKDYEIGQDKIVFSLPAAQQPPTLVFSETDFTGVSGEVLLLDGMIQVDWNGDAVSDVLVLINALPNTTDISFIDPSHLPGV